MALQGYLPIQPFLKLEINWEHRYQLHPLVNLPLTRKLLKIAF